MADEVLERDDQLSGNPEEEPCGEEMVKTIYSKFEMMDERWRMAMKDGQYTSWLSKKLGADWRCAS